MLRFYLRKFLYRLQFTFALLEGFELHWSKDRSWIWSWWWCDTATDILNLWMAISVVLFFFQIAGWRYLAIFFVYCRLWRKFLFAPWLTHRCTCKILKLDFTFVRAWFANCVTFCIVKCLLTWWRHTSCIHKQLLAWVVLLDQLFKRLVRIWLNRPPPLCVRFQNAIRILGTLLHCNLDRNHVHMAIRISTWMLV